MRRAAGRLDLGGVGPCGGGPSTIDTFLRSFSWGHARKLDAVAAEMLARAWAAGAGPDLAGEFTIDVDSSIHETYGLQKEGGEVLQSIAHSKYGIALNHLPSGRFVLLESTVASGTRG